MAPGNKNGRHRSSTKSSKNQKNAKAKTKAKKPKPSPAVLAAESRAAVTKTLGSLLAKNTNTPKKQPAPPAPKAAAHKAKRLVVEDSASDSENESGGGDQEGEDSSEEDDEDDEDDEEEDEKDARIRELEAYIEGLSQMQAATPSQQAAAPVFEKPEGDPGRSTNGKRKGYKLRPALGVSNDVFNDLKSHIRKGLTLFKFKTNETFRQQDLRKRQAMFPHMLDEFPELITKHRYPRLWIIDVLTKYCFNNRRAYHLKKARSRTGRNRSLTPPPSAQRTPTFSDTSDGEESEDEKLLCAVAKLLKNKPKYAARLGLKRKAVAIEDQDEDEEPPRSQRRLEGIGSADQEIDNDNDTR